MHGPWVFSQGLASLASLSCLMRARMGVEGLGIIAYISVRNTITIPENCGSLALIPKGMLSWLKRCSVSKVPAVQA